MDKAWQCLCREREERARQDRGPLAFLLVTAAQLCGSSHGGRGRERRWSASGLRLSDECDKDRGVRMLRVMATGMEENRIAAG